MKNELLRHSLSTMSYRFDIAVADLDADFAAFSAGNNVRSADQLLTHIIYLIKYKSVNIINNQNSNEPIPQDTFFNKIDIFKRSVINLDKILVEKDVDIKTQKLLIQGPFSDVFTHIGQLLTLRRLYGNPANSGNYSTADLKTGLI